MTEGLALSHATATSGAPRIAIGQCSSAGRKPTNDNSYGVQIPDPAQTAMGIAMAVADGLSSSSRAKAASETCLKTFLEDFYGTPETWAVKRAVGTVLKAINDWLFSQGQTLDEAGGMACTFSGAILKAGTAHIFHAGDSRIALLRGGALETLTRDHRTRVNPVAQGLSRAVGAAPSLEIDYAQEPIMAGDVLVFTTDGVHDYLPPAELARLIGGADTLDAAARAVVDAAFAAGSPDNLTCQLVRIVEPGTQDVDAHTAASAQLPFPPELEAGMTFEGYAILRELSTSKRGQVYLARDGADGPVLVLKTPSVNFEDDPVYIEMFSREEWIGRSVSSPNVIRVFNPARPRRHLYTLVEYCDGQTLRQWMADHPRPAIEDVRRIVEQIVAGLKAIHRRDIVHGDLKADNVMIDRDGVVKIIDFGSARAAGQDDSGRWHSALIGAVATTPPEYLNGAPPSRVGDIFALGVLTYEMLSDRLPYGEGFYTRRDVDRRRYTPLARWRDDLPVWIDAALAASVDKDPERRTRDLDQFFNDLRRPNPKLTPPSGTLPFWHDPMRLWRLVALVEAGLLVAILLAIVLFWR